MKVSLQCCISKGMLLNQKCSEPIDDFRQNSNIRTEGVVDKMTRTPDGSVDILAIDEFVFAASASLMSNPQPFLIGDTTSQIAVPRAY